MKAVIRYEGLAEAARSAPPHGVRTRPTRRWYRRRGSRLDKVLERNARWVAEARRTPPLYHQDAA
jgi:hypothetical protein